MLKRLCMGLDGHACRGLISSLWVGDTAIVATLVVVLLSEVTLIWFLRRTWRGREPIGAAAPELVESVSAGTGS